MKKVNYLNGIYIPLTLLLLLLLMGKTVYGQNHCKEVIGYYPGWQWYDRSKLVNPETIEYSKYTIINYAFLYPLADGTITLTDPWGDKNLLLGSINWSVSPAGYDSSFDLGNPDYHVPNTSLIYHAHINNTQVMMSIGGWTLSNDFSSIAASPTKRSNFAHSCNELIRVYDIDGIDIDWEYPGFADHGGTPSDIINYTLLLQEVRDSLDFMESEVNKELLLTAAFSADPAKMDDIDWDEVVPLLDYINLMSYDLFGAFSSEANHNSPLYEPEVGNPDFNCNSAVERLMTEYNVPAEKLNLGLAFYGRSVKTNGAPTLHGSINGSADLVTFSADEGTPQYYNILDKMNLFDENWDDIAMVPYLTGQGTLNTFLSYDNEQSIGLKGQYIVDKNLAGAIIWEITGDYIETSPGSGIIGSTPLVDTLNLALCHPPTDIVEEEENEEEEGLGIENVNTNLFSIYPNPTNGQLNLIYNQSTLISRVFITNITGEIIYNTYNSINQIDLNAFDSGVYFLNVESESKVTTHKIIKQ